MGIALFLWKLQVNFFPIFTHINRISNTIKMLIKSSIKNVLDKNRIHLIDCMLVQDQFQEGQ